MRDTPPDLEVYTQPPPPAQLEQAAAAVIDILRASTVHAALLGGGAAAIYPAAEWPRARQLLGQLPGSRLIGEIGSLPGPGAEYGNSPTEFAALNVAGWTAVHVTGNGTRALNAAAGAPFVLSACLRNLSACAQALHREAAEQQRSIAIVCSGDHGGAAASFEDTAAAGAYVEALSTLAGDRLQLGNGALIALKLWQTYADAPLAALREAPHGRDLIELGFGADLEYAAELDAAAVVPALSTDRAGRPLLRPA